MYTYVDHRKPTSWHIASSYLMVQATYLAVVCHNSDIKVNMNDTQQENIKSKPTLLRRLTFII